MTPRDRTLALTIVLAWAMNFPATLLALRQFDPMTVVFLRYFLVAIPTVVFTRPRGLSLRWLVAYGLSYGVAQFGLLYAGMSLGIPSGAASILIQSSAPFTVILGIAIWHEKTSGRAGLGLAVACGALAWMGTSKLGDATPGAAGLVILGGLAWAAGNVCIRASHTTSALRFTLWMSAVPPIPAAAIELTHIGPARAVAQFRGLTDARGLVAVAAVLYIAGVATVLASAGWVALLARYPMATVAPTTLLMPVLALGLGWLFFAETPSTVELVMSALVLLGVWLVLARGAPGRSPATAARQLCHRSTRCRHP